MPQRIFVDRGIRASYFLLVLAGCRGTPGAVVPEDVAPVDRAQVAEWVAATRPSGQRLLRFKWLFQDERSSAGGRGSARIAAPDSLRFDVAGPFGADPAAAVVVGDSALWAEPPDAVKRLVPNYPLLWGLLGVARPPDAADGLRGIVDGPVTIWQYLGPSDTVAYAWTRGASPRLVTEVRQGGELLGRVETELDSTGAPRRAQLVVPGVPARLDLTFLSTARASFGPDIWTPYRP
jgi:hypothetical protein